MIDSVASKYFGIRNAKFLFSLVGALLVVLTFAIKDDYRERVKSLGESIDAAESTFIIRYENERIYNLISHHRDSLDIFHPPNPGGGTGSWDLDVRRAEADHDEVGNSMVTLDNISRLAEKIPTADTHRHRVSIIRNDMQQFEADWISFQILKAQHPDVIRNPRADPNVFDRLVVETNRIGDSASSIFALINALGVDVLRDAEIARGGSERKYHKLNIVSYVLYAFGALLTVAGVFLGIEGAKPGE
jgi:hypothetical protein